MPRTTRKQPQPHTFPEQEAKPRKKRYLVTGPQRVGEVEKGGYVELALTPDQEACLIQAGCVEVAAEMTAPKLAPEPATHTKWSTAKKNRPSKADTTEQE